MKVYLDNGATTRVDDKVVEQMGVYFRENYGNASSLHSFGVETKKALERAREIIARKINADVEQIIFTSGGSESNNLAIKGVANKCKKGHFITSKIEHSSVLETFRALENDGFSVTYLNVDRNGFVDIRQLEKSIGKDTLLVSIMHANNEIGVIQDIKKIGNICKKYRILFHTDAVQSFCKVNLDVKDANVDFVSLSAHKIHGPKGIGALFIKDRSKIRKEIFGGDQEFNLRAGTENVASAVGFAKAIELIKDGDLKRMKILRDKLIEGILKIPNTKLNGDLNNRLVNNVNICFNGIEGESLLLRLDDRGIAVSTGSACGSKKLGMSHVLLGIGLNKEETHGSLRFTLSKYTTKEDIDYTLKVLKEEVEKLRRVS